MGVTYDSADHVTLIEYPTGRSLAYTYDAVWQKIFSNFLIHVGDPLIDLPDALQDDLDRLESKGVVDPNFFILNYF